MFPNSIAFIRAAQCALFLLADVRHWVLKNCCQSEFTVFV